MNIQVKKEPRVRTKQLERERECTVVREGTSRPVGPDWANFECSLQRIPQKIAQYLVTYLADWKKMQFFIKTTLTTFWPTFGEIGLLLF